MRRHRSQFVVVAAWFVVAASVDFGRAQAPPVAGYRPSVAVAAPTRLDYVFALANQSPAEPPADWLPGYDSTSQRYELFAPPRPARGPGLPLVLFVSAGPKPAGWAQWQAVCRQAGIAFASPFDAGNDCPAPRRIRIVLDVLDDVRRRLPIDPDRTYLAGFSGGARIACGIAFALPELFGGAAVVGGAESLREESWLRRRVAERLSVALITGETDFNRGELERFRGPVLAGVGVRTKVWVVPNSGHAIPDATRLAEAYRWLEEGTAARRALAARRPASRIAADKAPSRTEWSADLLAEAKRRLAEPAGTYDGLMQLQGISVRWAGLPAAEEAARLLAEYDARAERPWEADDLAEQRRFLLAEARGLSDYAAGPLPPQYARQRASMIGGALERWKLLQTDDPDGAAGKEAARRIEELERLLAAPPP